MSEPRGPKSPDDSDATTRRQAKRPPFVMRTLGRFRLEAELGAGGMGRVYRAVDTRSGQEVALKELFELDPTSVYRLKREFRRMADISHKNLVSLYELCEDNGQWFFTMELLDGRNLYEAMQAARGDLDVLRELLRQLTRGVHALHQAGKIHRDLKPYNALVTSELRVVLLDFGLVDEIDHKTLFGERGMIEGTPLYMAPEQAAGQFPMPASDWYAVGVILFEALTGRVPFEEDPINDKLCVDAPRLSSLLPNIPHDLDDLVAGLLRRVPTERPGAAEIFRWCAPDRVLTVSRRNLLATELIERQEAMAALYDTFDQVLRGSPACIDLVGPAGIGKTALIRRFKAEVVETGGLILEGQCSQRESVPFRAFDGLVDAVTGYLCSLPAAECETMCRDIGGKLYALTQIFTVLARIESIAQQTTTSIPEPREGRRQAFQGLKVLLHRIAERRPTVIVLDNLQWGDLDSASLLNHILASPGVPPALFVTAYRRSDTPILQQVALQRALSTPPYLWREVELAALSFEASVELAGRITSRDSSRDTARRTGRKRTPNTRIAQQIARESAGNPAMILALVEESERSGRAGLSPPGEGDLLRRLVRSRLARVDDEAREVFGRIVVADSVLPMALLQATGAWQGDLLALLAQLRSQGLVQLAEEGEVQGMALPDEQIQQASLAILDPELIRRSHGDLATAYIVTNTAGPEKIARHLHAAGRDDAAADHAREGALAALKALAFDRAAELYGLALACKPDQWFTQRERAQALVLAGRGVEAAPLFLAAAKNSPPNAAADLERKAAEHYFNYGHLERGSEILRTLLESAEVQVPQQIREVRGQLAEMSARLVRRGYAFVERSDYELSRKVLDRIDLCWVAGKGLMLNDPSRSSFFLVRCALLALDAGEPQRIAKSLALCGLSHSGGNQAVGTAMLDASLQLAQRIRDHYAIGLATLCKGILARNQGHWRTALTEIDFGVQYLRDHCPGRVWEGGLGQASTMAALEAMGELRIMSERSESLYQRAQAIGDVHSSRIAAIYSALTLVAAGKPKQARSRIRDALAQWPRDGFHVQDLHALKIGVYCDLYERRPLDAWQRVQNVWTVLVASDFLDIASRRAEAFLLRARAALATLRADPTRHAAVAEVITEDIAQLEREGHPHLKADANLLRAGLAACRGDAVTARRHLQLAKKGFDAAEMGLNADIAERLLHVATQADAGKATARLDAHMHMQNITNIDAWMRVMAPGLVAST